MVVRWRFVDPTDATSYTFPINPKEGGSLERAKTINYENTSAPGGKTLIFEGQDEPLKLSFSGTILDEAHLEAFETWFVKRHQIEIHDDLGRVFVVYITRFAPKRKRSAIYPWKHEFDCDATVLSWT